MIHRRRSWFENIKGISRLFSLGNIRILDLESTGELDALIELVRVFWDDTIHDDRWVKIPLRVGPDARLDPGSNEIVDKIHAAFGFEPIVISIRMLGLDYDVGMQSHAADQGEISKRGKPSGGIYGFVSDYQNHNELIGVSLIIYRIGNELPSGPVF